MIIILTPIKNEEWILERFLTVCSEFADSIIIADQKSSDNSKIICLNFPKVYLIDNPSEDYSEAQRQNLLINTARQLFPSEKKIFFCLDADEIIAANGTCFKMSWEKIKEAEAGTCLYFEKPDLLPNLNKCVRWRDNYFPIGYVDDGALHRPKEIHSTRIPNYSSGAKIYIDEIKFLHFAHTRTNVQSSKFRYYSALENIKGITPFYRRRFAYHSFYKEDRRTPSKNIELTPSEWLENYNKMNLKFDNFLDPLYSWQDLEVLKIFKKFGYKKFRWDNFWEFNWEECRLNALRSGVEGIPTAKIKEPSLIIRLTAAIVDSSYLLYLRIKRIKNEL